MKNRQLESVKITPKPGIPEPSCDSAPNLFRYPAFLSFSIYSMVSPLWPDPVRIVQRRRKDCGTLGSLAGSEK